MLLCIDTGNTNSVFSIWDGARFLCHWRISSDHRRTADEYYVWLSSLIGLHRLDVAIDACIISSTVPRVVFNLRVLCNRYFDTRPLVVGRPDCLLPVAPRVDAGVTVGPDRLVGEDDLRFGHRLEFLGRARLGHARRLADIGDAGAARQGRRGAEDQDRQPGGGAGTGTGHGSFLQFGRSATDRVPSALTRALSVAREDRFMTRITSPSPPAPRARPSVSIDRPARS